jgi:hypothetical protein
MSAPNSAASPPRRRWEARMAPSIFTEAITACGGVEGGRGRGEGFFFIISLFLSLFFEGWKQAYMSCMRAHESVPMHACMHACACCAVLCTLVLTVSCGDMQFLKRRRHMGWRSSAANSGRMEDQSWVGLVITRTCKHKRMGRVSRRSHLHTHTHTSRTQAAEQGSGWGRALPSRACKHNIALTRRSSASIFPRYMYVSMPPKPVSRAAIWVGMGGGGGGGSSTYLARHSMCTGQCIVQGPHPHPKPTHPPTLHMAVSTMSASRSVTVM